MSGRRRILICGSGLAGLSAALAALAAGAAVEILEKAPDPGGSTILSTGLIWTFADYDALRAAIPDGQPELQWLVQDGIEEGWRWLTGHGVALGPETRVLGHGRGRLMQPPQGVEALLARIAALGGRLRTNTALERLHLDRGRVTGVQVLTAEGGTELLDCDAVVLATGGFQGNPELLTRYVVPDAANLLLRSNPWSTGDGFLAALEAGAAASPGLGRFYGHALAAPPARWGLHDLGAVSQFQGPVGVAVNRNGERFADEGAGTGEEGLNQSLARQPGGAGFYITDAAAQERELLPGVGLVPRSVIDRARNAHATLVTADSLDALCRDLASHGVPAGRLRAELYRYNELVLAGQADALPPPRTRPVPLTEPPFHAVAVKAAITFTMGGIAIDERARVLRRAGGTSPLAPVPDTRAYADLDAGRVEIGGHYRQAPIPGLFAAGCDAGNISHGGYMGGLATALMTGLTAGRSAAAHTHAPKQ